MLQKLEVLETKSSAKKHSSNCKMIWDWGGRVFLVLPSELQIVCRHKYTILKPKGLHCNANLEAPSNSYQVLMLSVISQVAQAPLG